MRVPVGYLTSRVASKTIHGNEHIHTHIRSHTYVPAKPATLNPPLEPRAMSQCDVRKCHHSIGNDVAPTVPEWHAMVILQIWDHRIGNYKPPIVPESKNISGED